MENIFEDYETLFMQLIEEKISANFFQEKYIKFFKKENRNLSGDLYNLLEKVFSDCDAFTSDESLLLQNPNFYINEMEFRKNVCCAQNKLTELRGK